MAAIAAVIVAVARDRRASLLPSDRRNAGDHRRGRAGRRRRPRTERAGRSTLDGDADAPGVQALREPDLRQRRHGPQVRPRPRARRAVALPRQLPEVRAPAGRPWRGPTARSSTPPTPAEPASVADGTAAALLDEAEDHLQLGRRPGAGRGRGRAGGRTPPRLAPLVPARLSAVASRVSPTPVGRIPSDARVLPRCRARCRRSRSPTERAAAAERAAARRAGRRRPRRSGATAASRSSTSTGSRPADGDHDDRGCRRAASSPIWRRRSPTSSAGAAPDVFAELNTAFVRPDRRARPSRQRRRPSRSSSPTTIAGDGTAVFPRLVIDAGADSEVTVVERFTSAAGDTVLAVPVLQVRAGAGGAGQLPRRQRARRHGVADRPPAGGRRPRLDDHAGHRRPRRPLRPGAHRGARLRCRRQHPPGRAVLRRRRADARLPHDPGPRRPAHHQRPAVQGRRAGLARAASTPA